MERRGLVHFLQDIVRSIESIERFVADVEFESFLMNLEASGYANLG
jgi:uncharacterized protein with HEPN domain